MQEQVSINTTFKLTAEHLQFVSEMYRHHKPWLYSWLCKKLGAAPDAADLTQDTFTKLLSKHDLKNIAQPRAYLTTIAHGLMVSHIRRRDLERAYQATLTDPFLAEFPSPEIQAIAMEVLIAVDNMLYGLSPKIRAAYLLMQIDGLSYSQIAEKLDISVKTVGVYIEKAVLHCITYIPEN